MNKKEEIEEMMRICACSDCYDKAENYCSGYRACTYKSNFKAPVEKLIKAKYGNIKKTLIYLYNKIKAEKQIGVMFDSYNFGIDIALEAIENYIDELDKDKQDE